MTFWCWDRLSSGRQIVNSTRLNSCLRANNWRSLRHRIKLHTKITFKRLNVCIMSAIARWSWRVLNLQMWMRKITSWRWRVSCRIKSSFRKWIQGSKKLEKLLTKNISKSLWVKIKWLKHWFTRFKKRSLPSEKLTKSQRRPCLKKCAKITNH